MRRFEDVDIISTLRKIVNNNNLNYKTDFEYDVDILKTAAEGGRFLWFSRYNGTSLVSEHDAHIHDTDAHGTWRYYTDTKYYGVKAFAIEITGYENGKPVGDIYELHYNKHREAVQRSSFVAKDVSVTFKPPHWDKNADSTTRTFEVTEYNDNWRAICNRYGQPESVRHNLKQEDEDKLSEILDNFKIQYQEETTPGNINDYVRNMVKERFHEYGYTRDDMVFTTPEDACGAIKHKIPLYVLRPDNRAIQIFNKEDIDKALYAGHIFGLGARDKQLLNFFTAGNTLANLPFTKDELKTILFMALDKGKENFEDEKDKQTIDSIINVLDTALFAIETHDEITHEQDYELDDGVEQ